MKLPPASCGIIREDGSVCVREAKQEGELGEEGEEAKKERAVGLLDE